MSKVKRITAEQFHALDLSSVTPADVREPDGVLVSGIDGAVNLPFSKFPQGLGEGGRILPNGGLEQ